MNTLRIERLTKKYSNGVIAMNNISLELKNGIFGLLGPNGAGKSSLMRTIAGLQAPDSGELIFNGINTIADPFAIKKQLGYLPQDFGVYPKISAFHLLNHLAVLKGVASKAERQKQIDALLHKTNLYQHRNKSVSTFSGGMRQRFGIAQALLGNPQVIIVDEPTAGLDPEERNRFNNLLSEIGEDVIIILSTHLVEDVRNLCTQMAIMKSGQLVSVGDPDFFVKDIHGRIWTKAIVKSELEKYKSEYRVISSHFVSGKLHINVLADALPADGFEMKHADLEDVYFSQL